MVFESEASSVAGDGAVVAHESASVHLLPSSRDLAVPLACSGFSAEEFGRVARVLYWSLDARGAEFTEKQLGRGIGFLEF